MPALETAADDYLIKLSVRGLVEFVLQEGDLGGLFQAGDRALAGTRGHQQVQKSRPADYQAEVPISHQVEARGIRLEISGRIDGLYPAEQPPVLEEIKTTARGIAFIEADYNPLHWAQAKCYAYIYAHQHGLAEICLQLTYFQIDTHETKSFRETFPLADLATFFHHLLDAYLDWAQAIKTWQETRNASITALTFPHPTYRPGQRDMAVAVYRTIHQRAKLFAQAPTGIGKTIAVLFPTIKAIGTGLISKIFYLTAKTPGRLVAEKAIDDLRAGGLSLKTITLTAKDKL